MQAAVWAMAFGVGRRHCGAGRTFRWGEWEWEEKKAALGTCGRDRPDSSKTSGGGSSD